MTKQSVETPEIEVLGEAAMTKTEVFFENNGKRVAVAIFAFLVVASALFGYKSLVLDPKAEKASEALYSSQAIFEGQAPDYELALNGDGSTAGFLGVIEDYGSTPSGNLACHYAGLCYMNIGDNVMAKKYFKMYKAQKGIPAQILNAQNIGLQGDIAMNDGELSSAVEIYLNASKVSDNALTAPLYLRKAALAASVAGDSARAKLLYEQVIELYPNSIESHNAQKALGSIK